MRTCERDCQSPLTRGLGFNGDPTAVLQAKFCHDGARTQLTQLHCKAPLKIAQTFPLEKALSVCVMDASPGLLAGDYYSLAWHMAENACVSITTQGFTRVHPSQNNPCLLRQSVAIATGAHLEFFPEPLMLYKGATLRAETQVEMASEATLLMGEVFCAGRIQRGESFAFASYENRLRVRRENQLIFMNQTALRPAQMPPGVIGAWGDYTHGATFYTFGLDANATLCEMLRAAIDSAPHCYGGASLLDNGGIVVSLLGHRAYDLQNLVQQLRDTARQHL